MPRGRLPATPSMLPSWPSHGFRFGQNGVAAFYRKVAGREQIDLNAQQLFQIGVQAAQVEKRRAGQRIDQKLEVAAVKVREVQHRTKYAWVCRPVADGGLPHGDALAVQGG